MRVSLVWAFEVGLIDVAQLRLKVQSRAEEEDVFDCPWCKRTHKGCPSCGAETGCTDHYRPEDFAEVLAHCDCPSQEVDGVQFLTISDVERRLEEEDDDGDL